MEGNRKLGYSKIFKGSSIPESIARVFRFGNVLTVFMQEPGAIGLAVRDL